MRVGQEEKGESARGVQERDDFTFDFYVDGLRIGATLLVLRGARVCAAICRAVDSMQHQRAVRRHLLTSAGR